MMRRALRAVRGLATTGQFRAAAAPDGAVRRIIMDNPTKRNALTLDMYRQLPRVAVKADLREEADSLGDDLLAALPRRQPASRADIAVLSRCAVQADALVLSSRIPFSKFFLKCSENNRSSDQQE